MIIFQNGCIEPLNDLRAPMSWPIIADSSKTVKPRIVHHDHREGKLGLAQVGHVTVPPVFSEIMPLALWNCGCVASKAATGVNKVAYPAETMCLPRCVHIFTLFHYTCGTIKSECFVGIASQTPMRVGFLGRATACKKGTTFKMYDFGPVLLERVDWKRLSDGVIFIKQVVKTEFGCLAHPSQPWNSLFDRIVSRNPRRTRWFAIQVELIISKCTLSPIISWLLIHLITSIILIALLQRLIFNLPLSFPFTPGLIQRIIVALTVILEKEHGVLCFKFRESHLTQNVWSKLAIPEVFWRDWVVHVLTQALQPQ